MPHHDHIEHSFDVMKWAAQVLGLHVTAEEACEKWKAEPDKVPVEAQSYDWDAERKQFPMKPLPDFVARVREVAKTP